MPDTPSITIIKRFTYKGALEEWGNTYHFEGTTPADDTAWLALADAIIASEKNFLTTLTKFVRAYGYAAGNDNSVWQHDYLGPPDVSANGVIVHNVNSAAPGDAAATTRWYTGASSTRGKKIYCRKYWHDVKQSGTNQDMVDSAQLSAMNTHAAKMIDGTLPGGVRYCGPQGADLSDPVTSSYITTRTLKRRGKRPPTLP